jgi:dTMP kinase
VPRGLFVTLEGGEGAGKSLQAEALAAKLTGLGLQVMRTREPGGTALGERLRRLLLELPAKGELAVDPLTETLLFAAARAELVATVIAPAIERGEAVICDRFGDSTAAYQGYGRGVDLKLIDDVNAAATAGVAPDLVVLLDLPVEAGLARGEGARDRFEQEELAFHERVRAGYRQLAARASDRWLVVDATQPPEAVTAAIWARLETLLPVDA